MQGKLSNILLPAWLVVATLMAAPDAQAEPSDTWVDAGVTTQGTTYLFQGSQYLRFRNARLDPGYPRPLSSGGWQGLPGDFQTGIDAALYADDRAKTYFFKGNQYLRLTGVTVDPGYPRALPGGWQGLPAEFHSGIDAALFSDGHIYFFKGARYVRFTGNQLDPGYPSDLPGGWELPADLRQVDAAVSFGDKNYFFIGASYLRLSGNRVDPGYPLALPGGWGGLAAPGGSVAGSPIAPAGPAPTSGAGTPSTPPAGSAHPSSHPDCAHPASAATLIVSVQSVEQVSITEESFTHETTPIAGARVEVRGSNGVWLKDTTSEVGESTFLLPEGGFYVVTAGPSFDSPVVRDMEVLPQCINVELFDFVAAPDPCEDTKTCRNQDVLDGLMDCQVNFTNMMADCSGDESCLKEAIKRYDACVDSG